MFEDRVLVPSYRVTRIQTYQGHRVPDHAYYPSFGFQADTPVVVDTDVQPDDLDTGATAQNNFQGVIFYRCQDCEAVVRDDEVESHRCEDHYGPTH